MGKKKKKKKKKNALHTPLFQHLFRIAQNRFNRTGSRFLRLNRRFPVFSVFYLNSDYLTESDRIIVQFTVESADPV